MTKVKLEGEKEAIDKAWKTVLDKTFKAEDSYRKGGEEVIKTFEGANKVPFNILFANTVTLKPALYKNLPKVVVSRKIVEENPVGMVAAEVLRKAITAVLDQGTPEEPPLDKLFSKAVYQALLPGRGVIRFKYEATIEGEGETAVVKNEYICPELVPWDRIILAPSVSWETMPWAAIVHFMTKEEFKRNFPDYAGEIACDASSVNLKTVENHDGASDGSESLDLVRVYEVFDKENAKIYFISPANNEGLSLKTLEDTLKLSGFYPFCEPLRYIESLSSNIPIPLYNMYRTQAEELNEITIRIAKIVKAMKVRGFYDASAMSELSTLMASDDNTLIALNNTAQLVDRTFEQSIWMMPIEKLADVLQQLYRQRDEIKQIIYEISGLGDIMRGVSLASETATAQNLKSKWGTLRLRDLQKSTSDFIRNCVRIIAEILATSFSQETLMQMSGVRLPSAEKKNLLQMQMEAMQAQGQQPTPEMVEMLNIPTWEEVMQVLQNDAIRNFILDIETNSTLDEEIAEDKAEISEFLNAVAQFMNSVAPLISDGTMPFEAAKTMLLAITKRFRFGDEVEKSLRSLQAPQQNAGPDPEELAKKEQELSAREQQLNQAQQAFELENSKAQAEADLEKRQAMMEVDNYRTQALKEIEMSKTFAKREIAQEAMMSKQSADLYSKGIEENLKLKQKLFADHINAEKGRLGKMTRELETREAEVNTSSIKKSMPDGD